MTLNCARPRVPAARTAASKNNLIMYSGVCDAIHTFALDPLCSQSHPHLLDGRADSRKLMTKERETHYADTHQDKSRTAVRHTRAHDRATRGKTEALISFLDRKST